MFTNCFTIGGVYASGIISMIGCVSLTLFCLLSVIQLAMIFHKDEVVMKYKSCVILKLVLAITTGKHLL